MTLFEGWAWKADEIARRDAAHARLNQLRAAGRSVKIFETGSGYANRTFRGTADADLSDHDILLLCDSHPCFGGKVERVAGAFTATVYTD